MFRELKLLKKSKSNNHMYLKEKKICLAINNKYDYIAVTNPNALLAKFLWNHDDDKFSVDCFCNFQTDKKLK